MISWHTKNSTKVSTRKILTWWWYVWLTKIWRVFDAKRKMLQAFLNSKCWYCCYFKSYPMYFFLRFHFMKCCEMPRLNLKKNKHLQIDTKISHSKITVRVVCASKWILHQKFLAEVNFDVIIYQLKLYLNCKINFFFENYRFRLIWLAKERISIRRLVIVKKHIEKNDGIFAWRITSTYGQQSEWNCDQCVFGGIVDQITSRRRKEPSCNR